MRAVSPKVLSAQASPSQQLSAVVHEIRVRLHIETFRQNPATHRVELVADPPQQSLSLPQIPPIGLHMGQEPAMVRRRPQDVVSAAFTHRPSDSHQEQPIRCVHAPHAVTLAQSALHAAFGKELALSHAFRSVHAHAPSTHLYQAHDPLPHPEPRI